jgi:undecaprenyl-diphosphatase
MFKNFSGEDNMNSLKYVKGSIRKILVCITKYLRNDKQAKYSVMNIFMFLLSFIISIQLITHYYYHGSFNFDNQAISYVKHIRNEAMNNIFQDITMAGNVVPTIALTVIVIVILVYLKKGRDALYFSLNILGIWGLNSLLKDIFKRTRPPGEWLVNAAGYSFPSGHAMIFMGFSLLLIYYILTFSRNKRGRWLLSIFVLTYAILVGLSRIYLGVHYLSDVLTGWSIATLWVSVSIIIYRILNLKHYIT